MKLAFIFGTRPEVIKLAPVIQAALKKNHKVEVVLTGQHRELVQPLLQHFQVKPTFDLDVMRPNQSLPELSARVLKSLIQASGKLSPDAVLVQGDTTSAFIAGFWAFCNRIPVAHIEAGLRTYDLSSPFPEEANRQLLGRIADFHFAPTETAVRALKREGITRGVHCVGNTGIDALFYTLGRLKKDQAAPKDRLNKKISEFASKGRAIAITAHRRESFGEPLKGICQGILKLAEADESLRFIFPVHPNPNVRSVVSLWLENHPRILLCDPLPYVAFIELMNRAELLLTDSGGVQEEAPSLKKPILVLRDKTERMEGVRKGFSQLVGSDPDRIFRSSERALKRGFQGRGGNPYGDGRTSGRIIRILERHL